MSALQQPKPALWLIGPPGVGKSFFVHKKVKESGSKLLRIQGRIDRSFRTSRPLLFAQHRSTAPTIVWIEGADALTPDAQAFLRRIIETCSARVEFILETRDETQISSPIQSRCIQIFFKGQSQRQLQLNSRVPQSLPPMEATHREVKQIEKEKEKIDPVSFLIKARQSAIDPTDILLEYLPKLPEEQQNKIKWAWGSGRSIWALAALAVLSAPISST